MSTLVQALTDSVPTGAAPGPPPTPQPVKSRMDLFQFVLPAVLTVLLVTASCQPLEDSEPDETSEILDHVSSSKSLQTTWENDQFQDAEEAGSCGEVLKVYVDTGLINTPGVGASLLQMCESIGVCCSARDQLINNTVTWQLVYESDIQESCRVEEMDEVLSIIPVNQFVAMVNSQVKKAGGESHDHTLTEFVQQLQLIYPAKHVSLAAYGMDKYFRDQKQIAKRRYIEVRGQKSKGTRKVQDAGGVAVTRFQVEEAIVATQVETGCCCRLTDSAKDVAELVKWFSKAVMEKPNKKNRFDSVFSFLEEGRAAVKADKTGAGLLKVWELQLQQLHNLGAVTAAAIAQQFRSPLALKQAYTRYPGPDEAWKVTENIMVRRGAGILETGRRVGQQMSKKIHMLLISDDPNMLLISDDPNIVIS